MTGEISKSKFSCPACHTGLSKEPDSGAVFCLNPECTSHAAALPQEDESEEISYLRLLGAVSFENYTNKR